MKELKTNQVVHVVECMIDFNTLKDFIERETGTKIEGDIRTISTYQYGRSDEIEFTIKSVKEDRLRELTHDISN